MRRNFGVVVLFMLVMLVNAVFGQAQKYNIDKSHSGIGFEVAHLVITDVQGEFKDYDVNLMLDHNNVANSTVETRIKVASIDTDEQKRDDHLRSADFFDAETHPEIVFKSKKIEKKGDNYVAQGDLTIRGVTKEVSLPFEVKGPIQDPRGNTRVGINAEMTINRQDYGVSWNKTLDAGGVVVGDEVKINIKSEFVAAQ
jgi:polyisoprenoid-binding protein YceI